MAKARMKWTDGKVRQVFALRAEGKTMGAIAGIMGTGNGQVSMILTRVRHADVDITQNVLDKVAAIRPARPGRTPGSKNKPKVLKSEEVNPVMAAAALKASASAGSRGMKTWPELPSVPKPYTEAIDEAHLKITQPLMPVSTKADALMDVLNCVKRGNAQRQRVAELRTEATTLEDVAKRTEDSTFVKLTALHELGFSQAFLNAMLTESGLCTEGRFNIK